MNTKKILIGAPLFFSLIISCMPQAYAVVRYLCIQNNSSSTLTVNNIYYNKAKYDGPPYLQLGSKIPASSGANWGNYCVKFGNMNSVKVQVYVAPVGSDNNVQINMKDPGVGGTHCKATGTSSLNASCSMSNGNTISAVANITNA